MRAVLFYDLGLQDYMDVWNFQKELVERRIEDEIPDTIVFCEHYPVFTIGKHGGRENLKVLSPDIPVYEVERGGNITFHGPGQLVAYFIFRVDDVTGFSRKILNAGVKLFREFGLDAYVKNGYPGVWIGDSKIASVGIAVRKWVTFHGIALNINVDLKYFDMIVPCGIKGVKMTSLEELLGRKADMERIKKIFVEKLKGVLGISELIESPKIEEVSYGS